MTVTVVIACVWHRKDTRLLVKERRELSRLAVHKGEAVSSLNRSRNEWREESLMLGVDAGIKEDLAEVMAEPDPIHQAHPLPPI